MSDGEYILWTEYEAGKFLRMTALTVKKMAKRRQIPAIFLPGDQVRFVPAELLAWTKTQRGGIEGPAL